MFVEVGLVAQAECFLPIAGKLGIPVIGTITQRSWKLADRGLINNPAVIPLEIGKFRETKMNFVERVQNLWYHLILDHSFQNTVTYSVEKFHREHFTEDLLRKRLAISMIFINNHASLLFRSIPPNVIEIGGIHVKPAKPLSEVSFELHED